MWLPLLDGAGRVGVLELVFDSEPPAGHDEELRAALLPDAPPAGPAGRAAAGVQLRPGDRVLLYTDGIVEARSPAGEFFGEDRLADFVVRAETAGDPPPETLRRPMRSVMEHQSGRLQDDATIVLVEWRAGREDQWPV